MSHRTPSLHFNSLQSDGIKIPYSPCKVSINNLSCEQVRANIVQEIVATEKDYVKHLKDVVEVSVKSHIFKTFSINVVMPATTHLFISSACYKRRNCKY